MKHKIKLIQYDYEDRYGIAVEIDGRRLFYDGESTYNCIEEILSNFNIEAEIEYISEYEERKFITKKMKLVPVEGDE
jgi:hypothetical protein